MDKKEIIKGDIFESIKKMVDEKFKDNEESDKESDEECEPSWEEHLSEKLKKLTKKYESKFEDDGRLNKSLMKLVHISCVFKCKMKPQEGRVMVNIPDEEIKPEHIFLEAENMENDYKKFTYELNMVAYYGAFMVFKGVKGEYHLERAPNGSYFTLDDLINAMQNVERKTRCHTSFLGKVDCHHTYFEGLQKEKDGSYLICWGS